MRIKTILKSLVPKRLYPALRKLYHKAKRKLLPQPVLISGYRYQEPSGIDDKKRECEAFPYKPLVSVLMPVYNVDPQWLAQAIDSVRKQIYPRWELCIVDDCSTNPHTTNYLKQIDESNIRIVFSDKNQNISKTTNDALKFASGEYVAFMDHDDEITADALYEVVKAINANGAEILYSDEDKIDLKGKTSGPHFKPDFSLDLLLSQNYMSHLTVIKKSIVDEVGGCEAGLEGSQDYDLLLKAVERTQKIHHIPKVLYHWRMIPGSTAYEFDEKNYAQSAGSNALTNYLRRNRIEGTVEDGKFAGTYRVRRSIVGKPRVSILIPFRDRPDLLKHCIDSIVHQSTYAHYEILGISNFCEESASFELMKYYERKFNNIRFHEVNIPFNYSKINNHAARLAQGEHLLLVNNDVEILSPDWIESLLEHSQRPEVGAVGAKLYYADYTVQHAGVILGIGGVAGHSHKHLDRDHVGYICRPHLIQNYSAVTAACLMVKKAIFEKVGGFNETDLAVAFNDVDFCLRLREAGYVNVFTPYCEAIHHESISRGLDNTPEKEQRFEKESRYILMRHQGILKQGDPYYNPNLSLVNEETTFRYRRQQEVVSQFGERGT